METDAFVMQDWDNSRIYGIFCMINIAGGLLNSSTNNNPSCLLELIKGIPFTHNN